MAGLDDADEREDPVARHERADGRQRTDQLDVRRGQADLLLGLPQRRLVKALALVLAPAGEGDLAGVPLQVGPPFGEDGDQIRPLEVERDQHRGVGGARGVESLRLLRGQQQLAQPGRPWA